jgi:ubiquinone/menaquinone biosynthesis C-methylase UbiE
LLYTTNMPEQDSHFLNPENILKNIELNPGMHVGDLGCGTGYMSFAASKFVGQQGGIYAVDVQKAVLEQVEREARAENINTIHTVWSDLEMVGATKIPEHSLDVVFLINVLFQINEKKSIFNEAKRLLKESGTLLLVDWKAGTMAIGPPADKRVDLASVSQVATEVGFSKAKDIDAGTYHFGAVYKVS